MATIILAQLIGPLVTTFTPRSGCNHVSLTRSASTDAIIWTQGYQNSIGLESGGQCLPYGAAITKGYYSPGICPSDWETEAFTNGLENTHNCCPSFSLGKGIFTNIEQGTTPLVYCLGEVYAEPTMTIALYNSREFVSWITTYGTADDTNGISRINVWAAGVQVRFKDSDFGISESITTLNSTSPTNTLAKSTSKSTSTLGTTSPPGAQKTASPPTSGLPSSAKIGLGVGISIAFVLISVLAFLLIQRHQLPGSEGANTIFGSGGPLEKPELDTTTKQFPITTVLASKPICDDDQAAELGNETSHNNTAELGYASNERATPHPHDTSELNTAPPLKVKRKEPLFFTSSLKKPEPSSLVTNPDSQNQGPLPAASELYPEVISTHDDEDLAYQERRLQERRELIAEKERLARHEDALMERRAEAKRKSGRPS